MSDIKLFQLDKNRIAELEGKSVTIEKSLQNLIEKHLEIFLGVKFLATEYTTGAKHGGRIDTLGIDENNCPVIIEYKRLMNENVVNQGLYYLDWLLDHKAEFQLLAMKVNKGKNKEIEWENARLICIAGDFTKYDSYAIEQINRNIELIKYKKFENLMLFELVNQTSQITKESKHNSNSNSKNNHKYKTVAEYYDSCNEQLKNRFEELSQFIFLLGEDVKLSKLNWYFAFKNLRTFASFIFQPVGNTIVIYVHADIKKIKLEKGFTRDVSNIGHHGLGNLEIRITKDEDVEKAKPYIIKSFERS
ncbi:MAG TPA: DUF5655 domain-containing protein [Ignavibacteriaceae bacterium]|nr:DUF5655 domain-containing protein [Ignavibacteriaceae bacterium]